MDAKQRKKSMQKANQTSIYNTMIIGILIGIIGAYLRYAKDSVTLSIVSWLILFIGAIIACKAVFKILNAQ